MISLAPGELVRRQSEGCLHTRIGPAFQKSTNRVSRNQFWRERCRPQYFALRLRAPVEKLVDHRQVARDGCTPHGRVEVARLSVWEHEIKAFLATARQRSRKWDPRG